MGLRSRVPNFLESVQARQFLIPGILCLLLGMLLPSNKLYHQIVGVFLWVPGLVLLWRYRKEAGHFSGCVMLYAALGFLLWSALSATWSSAGDELRRAKYLLLIALSLWTFMLLGGLPERVWLRLLAGAAALMGVVASYAWMNTYLVQGMPWSFRIAAGGQLDHSILAAQVFGVFMLMFYNLMPQRRLAQCGWLLVICGFAAYLLFAQSKGIWLAMLVSICLTPLWRRETFYRVMAALSVLAVVVFYLFAPDVLTQRGMSYRPELFEQGLQLYLSGNKWLGLGLGEHYLLSVQSLGAEFDHPHNLFLNILIQVGAVGFVLWCLMWGCVALTAWQYRRLKLGSVVMAVWVFASLAFLSDGFYVWDKPRDIWFITWIPLGLALVLWRLGKTSEQPLQ